MKISASGQTLWETLDPTMAALWQGIDAPGQAPAGVEYTLNPPSASTEYTVMDSYPRALQLSTGEVLLAGDVDALPANSASPSKAAWVIRPPFAGCSWGACNEWELWKAKDMVNDRHYGTAVLLHTLDALDRLLVFGGSHFSGDPLVGNPTSTVEEYVPGTIPSAGVWWPKANMKSARTFLNAVVLPTGKIFLVGGKQTSGEGDNSVAATVPELYDPADGPDTSGSSTTLEKSPDVASPGCPPAEYPTPRLYHSLAVLLLDGRILVAGGEDVPGPPACGPPSAYTGEIYSPPYIFQGTRPTIEQCPNYLSFDATAMGGGVTFAFKSDTGLSDNIDGVVLLRPAAVTHSFDSDQRYIELSYQVTQSGINYAGGVPNGVTHSLVVEAPWEMLGPDGWYMLFVLSTNSNGDRIPSVGQFVHFE